jgi:hypothetical protein
MNHTLQTIGREMIGISQRHHRLGPTIGSGIINSTTTTSHHYYRTMCRTTAIIPRFSSMTGQHSKYSTDCCCLHYMIRRNYDIKTVLSSYQTRCFGKVPRKGGKKHGYTYDEVKLQICYSDYDLDIDEDEVADEELEDMTFLKVRFDLNYIKETVEEIFDDSRNLQYYEQKQWRPLTDLSTIAMQKYRAGKTILKVRVPEHYDDTPIGEEPDDEHYDIDGNNTNKYGDIPDDELDLSSIILRGTIQKLVSKLKETNYIRSDGVIYGEKDTTVVYTITNTKTQEKIMTKDWVMQQADKDNELARLLIAIVGSLDHIVKCIHYDILWEHVKPNPRLHNGFRRT